MQEAALAALFEMAPKKAVSDRMVDAGAIDILVKSVKKGRGAARSLAAGVLGRMAIDIDVLVRLASQGRIPPLVK